MHASCRGLDLRTTSANEPGNAVNIKAVNWTKGDLLDFLVRPKRIELSTSRLKRDAPSNGLQALLLRRQAVAEGRGLMTPDGL